MRWLLLLLLCVLRRGMSATFWSGVANVCMLHRMLQACCEPACNLFAEDTFLAMGTFCQRKNQRMKQFLRSLFTKYTARALAGDLSARKTLQTSDFQRVYAADPGW